MSLSPEQVGNELKRLGYELLTLSIAPEELESWKIDELIEELEELQGAVRNTVSPVFKGDLRQFYKEIEEDR